MDPCFLYCHISMQCCAQLYLNFAKTKNNIVLVITMLFFDKHFQLDIRISKWKIRYVFLLISLLHEQAKTSFFIIVSGITTLFAHLQVSAKSMSLLPRLKSGHQGH